jgi:hypothetical protein
VPSSTSLVNKPETKSRTKEYLIALMCAAVVATGVVLCSKDSLERALSESFTAVTDPFGAGPLTVVVRHYSVDSSGVNKIVLPEQAIVSRSLLNKIDITAKVCAGKSANEGSLYLASKADGNTLSIGHFGELGACDPSYSCYISALNCVVPYNVEILQDDRQVPHGSHQVDRHPYESASASAWSKLIPN